jgi:hypothetical protein
VLELDADRASVELRVEAEEDAAVRQGIAALKADR